MYLFSWGCCIYLFTANKSKVYYGIPPEPDLGVVIEEENEDEDDKDKPKVTLSSSLQRYQTKNHKFTSVQFIHKSVIFSLYIK